MRMKKKKNTFKVRKVGTHGDGGQQQLFLKQIFFVEEQNHGRGAKPTRIDNLGHTHHEMHVNTATNGVATQNTTTEIDTYLLKQGQRFGHAIAVFVFKQLLIVLGNGRHKQDRGDVLKAVDPLPKDKQKNAQNERPRRA